MEEIKRATKATKEKVESFLKGSNPQERIIKIECGFGDAEATVIWRDEEGKKHYTKEDFYPFCWAKQEAGQMMYKGNRSLLKSEMLKRGIGVKALIVANEKGETHERMEKGYRNLWYAKVPMSNKQFRAFFEDAGVPIMPGKLHPTYNKDLYIQVAPNEQFMIQTGKRLFKGYDNYDDLVRMQFDIETSGLDKQNDVIDQIGIRTNKGFVKIIKVEGETKAHKIKNSREAIKQMFDVVNEIDPDVISGYNSEGFDFEFFDVFLRTHFGIEMGEETKRKTLPNGVFKRKTPSPLKLGGEVEYYYPTVAWGKHITDALFSVRRAQAQDSSMKKATLKYVTKYSKINKANRVYVPGNEINHIWSITEKMFGFNDKDGTWYKIDDSHPLKEGYEKVSGEYVVQRYLEDDIWETDKIELKYNESNFLVGKMLPLNFERMCTMGTAAIWKYLLMAWSYENDLAIPMEEVSRPFVGGLSRLLKVGYVPNVLKLDYNSLYPSIILSFGIKTPIDISDAMPTMLEYMLTQREYYKGLKKKYEKEAEKYKEELKEIELNGGDSEKIDELSEKLAIAMFNVILNDKMQLPLKIIANSYFGSFGSRQKGVFPWSDIDCAEETTCCGRQMLRLMLHHFTNLGYQGIVCDSVTEDTPLFIKYNESGMIDIKAISEMISEDDIITDILGRERDFSNKKYKVLSRSGWVKPSYIYRHKTDKEMYRVSDGDTLVDVTKDHSLFDSNKNEIKPTEIKDDTKLEYYTDNILDKEYRLSNCELKAFADLTCNCPKKFPMKVLNSDKRSKRRFIELLDRELEKEVTVENYSKTFVAGYNFCKS